MKVFVITLALAGLASTATLDAQILGSRPVPTSNGSINVDGSWRVVGRDGNGNTIYERRTQDRNGNILVQRGMRDNRGNMSIISTNTIKKIPAEVVSTGHGVWLAAMATETRSTSAVLRTVTATTGRMRDRNGNMTIIAPTPWATPAIAAAIAIIPRVPTLSATSFSVAAAPT